MNLGWCDVCISVQDVATSRHFYELLGFHLVEGDGQKGWAVVTNHDLRLGLFEAQYMDGLPFSLNFRGGDVFAIAEKLAEKGLPFASGPKRASKGGCSGKLYDPDGHLLFFDTAPGETKKL